MNLSELRLLVFRRDGKRATDGAICEWGTLDVSKDLLYLILLPAMGPLLYYCLAIFSSWDYFRRVKKITSTEPSKLPPISILKPIRGLDRELYENFASMCRLDYPEYEIIFGVGEADDPAIPLVARLQREFPETSIRMILGIEQLGASRKTNTLCRLVKEAKYDLLVMNDSDVRVEKSYLRDVKAAFSDPKVGVVTALFRSQSGAGLAARLDAIGVPTDSSASMLLERKFSEIDFAYGWTMAITKERLAEIGGFEAMVNLHSDDFALGNEMAKHGYRVELMSNPVLMVFPEETMGGFLKHELRWCIQLKNLRGLGYPGMFLTMGFAWSLIVGLMVPSWKIAASYFLAYLSLRLTLAWVAGVWGLRDPVVRSNLWLVPVRDALNLCLYIASFFSNKVEWRGACYRVCGKFMSPLDMRESAMHSGRV
jgi:ceramide glucosyltransferase